MKLYVVRRYHGHLRWQDRNIQQNILRKNLKNRHDALSYRRVWVYKELWKLYVKRGKWMNLRSRYGYLILALKQYPFERKSRNESKKLKCLETNRPLIQGLRAIMEWHRKLWLTSSRKNRIQNYIVSNYFGKRSALSKFWHPENNGLQSRKVYIDGTLNLSGRSINKILELQ